MKRTALASRGGVGASLEWTAQISAVDTKGDYKMIALKWEWPRLRLLAAPIFFSPVKMPDDICAWLGTNTAARALV